MSSNVFCSYFRWATLLDSRLTIDDVFIGSATGSTKVSFTDSFDTANIAFYVQGYDSDHVQQLNVIEYIYWYGYGSPTWTESGKIRCCYSLTEKFYELTIYFTYIVGTIVAQSVLKLSDIIGYWAELNFNYQGETFEINVFL
jgi:hypothetical protein